MIKEIKVIVKKGLAGLGFQNPINNKRIKLVEGQEYLLVIEGEKTEEKYRVSLGRNEIITFIAPYNGITTPKRLCKIAEEFKTPFKYNKKKDKFEEYTPQLKLKDLYTDSVWTY